jgi:hypothetical protein
MTMTVDQLIAALKDLKKADPTAGRRNVWVSHASGTNVGPVEEIRPGSDKSFLITQHD